MYIIFKISVTVYNNKKDNLQKASIIYSSNSYLLLQCTACLIKRKTIE